MNLDQHGLPMQYDGDRNDQLNRVGLLITAAALRSDQGYELTALDIRCARAIALGGLLHRSPGFFLRHADASPDNCSADQIIAALAGLVAVGARRNVARVFVATMKRFGFAQNVRDGLGSSADRKKTPDFMLFRAAPLFVRWDWALYPLALVVDVLLVFSAVAAVWPWVWRDDKGLSKRTGNDVDDNCSIVTFATCCALMPTPFSMLAALIYAKLRPKNFGNVFIGEKSPVMGALAWYHRRASFGNPEIAEALRPVVERYLT